MPFVNKKVHIDDFLKQLHERLKTKDHEDALTFFEHYLQNDLRKEIEGVTIPNWDGYVNAGDFDKIYPLVANLLWEIAARNSSEHLDEYSEANAVSIAFCEELNEFFECSGEEKYESLPIKSFADMVVKSSSAVNN